MDLPGALHALDQPESLPASVLSCISDIQNEGGIDTLPTTMRTIQMLSAKNQSILEEGLRELRQEAEVDENYRQRYRDRWNRDTSASLTTSYVEDEKRFRKKLQDAQKLDLILREGLHEVMTKWNTPLQILSAGKVKKKEEALDAQWVENYTALPRILMTELTNKYTVGRSGTCCWKRAKVSRTYRRRNCCRP
jgi:hypothetical protein